MNQDDIIYVSLLIFSIFFGFPYRKISNPSIRKNVGSIVGVLLVLIVAGPQSLHSFITFIVNAIIITRVSQRICHQVSFIFTFIYLCFFRTTWWFGIPPANGHTNLVQMMLTLKIVGLAFEVNSSKDKFNDTNDEKNYEDKFESINPSFIDIFHYCFNYVGVLTGPYYKYTTFRDSFKRPFGLHSNNKYFVLNNLKYVPIFAILFLLTSRIWPNEYALQDEFYLKTSLIYRFFYFWPCFLTFRMRIYIGLILSECVCIASGMGAYPEFTKPKSGHGPSTKHKELDKLSNNLIIKSEEPISYETVHNIDPYGSEFSYSYREGMKHWNMCIQYWLAVNIYKRCTNKKYRTAITMLVSAYWHGVYTGYYVCIATVPFVLVLEDIWSKLLLNKDGSNKPTIKFLFWFLRMNFLGYQGMAFNLLESTKILHYYNSIYHINLILGIFLYILGIILIKRKRKAHKN